MHTCGGFSSFAPVDFRCGCALLQLQFTNVSASTKDLTKSFGWDNHEAFMQHDVQELNRVLCENLEGKMKVELDAYLLIFCFILFYFYVAERMFVKT